MMQRTKQTAIFLVALNLVLASTGSAIAGEAGFDPSKEVVKPSHTVAFQNINPAIEMGGAWGDRGAGGHGTFGKFPPNFITPFHTHSGAYHGVVVSGRMTNPFVGEANPPEMDPGSYWFVPAESEHATACVSDTPCQFYFHADSAFDFIPVE